MSRNLVSKRNVFSISLVLLVLAAIHFTLRPRAARADDGVPIRGTFSVQFEGLSLTSNCAPGDANCNACINTIRSTLSSVYVEAQGIGDTSQGTMFIQVHKCFYVGELPYGTYAGIFTLTAPNGKDSVAGTYSGQNDSAGDFYGFGPFSGQLTVTRGTGKFAGATGTLRFTAASGPTTTAGAFGLTGLLSASNVGMAFYSVQGELLLAGGN